jgi:hypothetical protein
MNNQDFITVRRTQRTSGHIVYNFPTIKMEYPLGRFTISQKLANILNIDEGDGLMFGFNMKNKTAYVVKDDEPDAFIIRRKDKGTLRFTSKDLLNYFAQTFELSSEKDTRFLFAVSSSPNQNEQYMISPY